MRIFDRIREAIMVRMGIKLSTGRMEEICAAVETHLREKGGIVYGSQASKGRPGLMTWRFPESIGITAGKLEKFHLSMTPAMKECLIKAQQPTIDARAKRRSANLAKIRARMEVEKTE